MTLINVDMSPDALALTYIKCIRNWGKHSYATAYWRCMTHGGPSPDYKDFAISYMAAQAVRMNLEGFIK